MPPPLSSATSTGTNTGAGTGGVTSTANFGEVSAAQAQAYSTQSSTTLGNAGGNAMGSTMVGGGPGGMAAAGNQNFYGSIVQVNSNILLVALAINIISGKCNDGVARDFQNCSFWWLQQFRKICRVSP